ncbi:MAG: hypothetical protein NZ483_11180 [Verrucomicrobiae bacterium]|nr:hypothetical protein [Verrucomicrobiae bacterium]
MSAGGSFGSITGRVLALARELLSLPTAPYHEHEVRAAVEARLQKLSLRPQRDKAGNVMVRCPPGSRSRCPLVLMAHMDHPGFEVVGPQRLEFLGHVPREMFRGARVRIDGVERPVRVKKVLRQLTHGWLVETVEDSLPVGAMGVWDLPTVRARGGQMRARGIDDVLGVVVVLAVLEEAVRRRLRGPVWGLLTRAEEVGFHGAALAAQNGELPRDAVVISIEMSRERPWARCGQGPVVRVGDRLTVFDRDVVWYLGEVARREKISVQRTLMDGGTCEASALAAWGYRVGGVCMPLRCYHNIGRGQRPAMESVAIADLLGLVRLLVAAVKHWPPAQHEMTGWRERVQQAVRMAPRQLSG